MKRYTLYSIALVLLVTLVWVGCSTEQGPDVVRKKWTVD